MRAASLPASIEFTRGELTDRVLLADLVAGVAGAEDVLEVLSLEQQAVFDVPSANISCALSPTTTVQRMSVYAYCRNP